MNTDNVIFYHNSDNYIFLKTKFVGSQSIVDFDMDIFLCLNKGVEGNMMSKLLKTLLKSIFPQGNQNSSRLISSRSGSLVRNIVLNYYLSFSITIKHILLSHRRGLHHHLRQKIKKATGANISKIKLNYNIIYIILIKLKKDPLV